jgi:sugar lactone lactonase YvrE
MRLMKAVLSLMLLCSLVGCEKESSSPSVLLTLGDSYHTPDGCTLTDSGDIILSIPNFNNQALIAAGKLSSPQPPVMVKIDAQNKLTPWYAFTDEDNQPDTGTVGPMGCDIGPDGNLYVADNQLFSDPNHKSRLLRITVEDGKAVRCDSVVEGFIVSNAVIWQGDTVYVSETALATTPAVGANETKPPLMSGVYAFTIDELNNGPVKLQPWSANSADSHLIATYKTSNSVGFGADGLTCDAQGNLYCGIFEDGIVYKTSFNADGTVKETTQFAQAPNMACCDGIFWREKDNKIYVADMLINGVQAVDMQGKVTTIHKNGDTDGADGGLDQPCEVIVRGNELIVINMDMVFESDRLTNTTIDAPYTLSVIPLP